MRHGWLIAGLWAVATAGLWAEAPVGRPPAPVPATTGTATTPATTASAPAPEAPPDPAAVKVLDRLEAAGAKYPRIEALLQYREELTEVADVQGRRGKVYYQAASEKDPARFRIHFDDLREGRGPWRKAVEDYVFDGEWFTIRKERSKQQLEFQVAPPGEKIDALELGKGPFPVPFGQKAAEVVKYFHVGLLPPERSDPPETDHLRLLVRPEHKGRLKVAWIELWVSRQTSLPVRIKAEDTSENIKTADFDDVKTPRQFGRDTFKLPPPPKDWEHTVQPWRGGEGK